MQPIRMENAGYSRLRLVYDDRVVSFSLAANATLEDIGRTVGELANQHYGKPVAVDVTVGFSGRNSVRRTVAPTGLGFQF